MHLTSSTATQSRALAEIRAEEAATGEEDGTSANRSSYRCNVAAKGASVTMAVVAANFQFAGTIGN
jgi:hypothetical protein